MCRLADSFAKAGYLVVAPDLFKGDAIPADKAGSAAGGFNKTVWDAKHTVANVEAIIDTTIKTMKEKYGVKKLGAVYVDCVWDSSKIFANLA